MCDGAAQQRRLHCSRHRAAAALRRGSRALSGWLGLPVERAGRGKTRAIAGEGCWAACRRRAPSWPRQVPPAALAASGDSRDGSRWFYAGAAGDSRPYVGNPCLDPRRGSRLNGSQGSFGAAGPARREPPQDPKSYNVGGRLPPATPASGAASGRREPSTPLLSAKPLLYQCFLDPSNYCIGLWGFTWLGLALLHDSKDGTPLSLSTPSTARYVGRARSISGGFEGVSRGGSYGVGLGC